MRITSQLFITDAIVSLLAGGLALSVAQAGVHFEILKSFRLAPAAHPREIIQGTDGALYGTTVSGGTNSFGSVFKLNKDGSGYTVVHSFSSSGVEGEFPVSISGLHEASEGALYGTTLTQQNLIGRTRAVGTVFKLNKDGSGFSVLRSFESVGRDGWVGLGKLIEGSDGALYGTVGLGNDSSSYSFTIFRLNQNDGGYRILHQVTDAFGATGLIEGTDGALYGTVSFGSTAGGSTLFMLNKDGTGYKVLHQFMAEGSAQFIEGKDGALYGSGGFFGATDILFKLNKDGTGYNVLHEFGSNNDGRYPAAGLIEGADGALYGTTGQGGMYKTPWDGSIGGGTIFKLGKDGSNYKILHHFGNETDGRHPQSGLLKGSNGALCGITMEGGGTDPIGYPSGWGTIFELNNDGSGYSVVYRFSGRDGGRPLAGIVEGSDAVLYGTTEVGGGLGIGGTVFRLNRDGDDYRVLHTFELEFPDRWMPQNGVIEGSDGALYGTTSGVTPETEDGGTVFKINKNGAGYKVLHTFELYSKPSKLTEGSDGALYGTACCSLGGDEPSGRYYAGEVFKLNRDGSSFSVLHRFTEDDYGRPQPGVVEGKDGALYGTACCLYTGIPGSSSPYVFKLTRDGSGFSVLHAFDDLTNGLTAYGLMAASDGALYGTTSAGNGKNLGTVFRLEITGSNYQILHDFGPTTNRDGWRGLGPLLEGTDGALYGNTEFYVANSPATIFKLHKDGSGYETLVRPEALPCDTCGTPDDFPALSGLSEGRDGFLYGLINYNEHSDKVFKAKKDGSGYVELFSSFVDFVGEYYGPVSGLLQGRDNAFYGTTSHGGPGRGGTVFKLWPPETPDLSIFARARGGTGIELRVSGASGSRYQVQRSADLRTWTLLSTFSMPASGIYNYSDGTSPNSAAFYRAVWLP